MSKIDFIISALVNIDLTISELQKEIDNINKLLIETYSLDLKQIEELNSCKKYLNDIENDKKELIDQYRQEIKTITLH